jgi:hypothetical protein
MNGTRRGTGAISAPAVEAIVMALNEDFAWRHPGRWFVA